jgi:hypothetical protein
MIKADGSLNQTLEEQPAFVSCVAPEFLPHVVRFEKIPTVELHYTLQKQVIHLDKT